MAKKPNSSKYGPPAYVKAKPVTPTKPVPVNKSRPTYVKAKPVTPTKPVAIVNSAEERARRVTQSGLSALGPLPGKKAAPSSKPTASKPPQPTAAERAAAQRQNASLKKAKVSAAEARTIASANRSEASSKKPQVTRTTVNYRPTPSKPAKKPSTAKKYPNFEF